MIADPVYWKCPPEVYLNGVIDRCAALSARFLNTEFQALLRTALEQFQAAFTRQSFHFDLLQTVCRGLPAAGKRKTRRKRRPGSG